MDQTSIEKLCRLNADFYRRNHASFSETRQHAWSGWECLLQDVPRKPTSVVDVACGNLRFKTFLETAYQGRIAHYYAVDSCAELLPLPHDALFQELDIVSALVEGSFESRLVVPPCDLTVCFGFMHHVPTKELRFELMRGLVDKTARGGVVAVSFWQFAKEDAMREKALASTERGCVQVDVSLEEGDYLLGWKDVPGTYRYCHSFSDSEIDEVASVVADGTKLIDKFEADGRSGKSNGYLVFGIK